MAKIAIVSGLLLMLIGVTGALVAMRMVDEWWYAGIPALVGLLLVLCGWAVTKGRVARAISLTLAPVVGVAGVVGSFMPSGLNFSVPGSVAFVSSVFRLLTIVVGSGFVVLWLRSIVGAGMRKGS